ncbi:MAG TPA: PqiC family protein [Stenotrophobium sp.]|jgi:uncharacterized lipoprotein YmbA|nr:PqiC family protein [Stenotrophobium sp.]
MKMRVHRCWLAGAAAMLSACAAAPTRFYTLVPPAPATQTQATTAATLQIEVLPVEIPLQVDRPQMVVREGGGRIVPVETRQWIAPLATEIRSALSADLTHELGADDVYGIAAAPKLPTYRIALKVQRFDSALGAYARVDALWSIRDSDNGRVTCASTVSEPVPPGYAELAAGHQRAIAAIAAAIAGSIRDARQDHASLACPDKN